MKFEAKKKTILSCFSEQTLQGNHIFFSKYDANESRQIHVINFHIVIQVNINPTPLGMFKYNVTCYMLYMMRISLHACHSQHLLYINKTGFI